MLYPEYTRLTPEKTAIVATGLIMLLTWMFGYRGRRPTLREMALAVIETGRISLDIILIGAAAGIMVGIMSISGLAFGMTLQLIQLSGENVFALLLIIACSLRARSRPADRQRLHPDRDLACAGVVNSASRRWPRTFVMYH